MLSVKEILSSKMLNVLVVTVLFVCTICICPTISAKEVSKGDDETSIEMSGSNADDETSIEISGSNADNDDETSREMRSESYQGGKKPPSYLNITISSDRINVSRVSSLNITYKIESNGIYLEDDPIIIKIPGYLYNPSITSTSNCSVTTLDRYTLKLTSHRYSKNMNISLTFKVEYISPEAPLGNIYINRTTIKNHPIVSKFNINEWRINISNNKPKKPIIELVSAERINTINKINLSYYEAYNNTEAVVMCTGNDIETSNLLYNLYINNYIQSTNNSNLGGAQFSLKKLMPGDYEIKIGSDDGTDLSYSDPLTMHVLELTPSEYASQLNLKLLATIFIIFIIINSIINSKYYIKIINYLCSLNYEHIVIALCLVPAVYLIDIRIVPHLEIVVYLTVIVFSSAFLKQNFGKEDNLNSTSIKNLWTISIIGTTFIACILICILPNIELFSDLFREDRYDFIFLYYTMIIQVFGSILAIVVMFAVWFLENKEIKIKKSLYKVKIRNFMILYISIILLAIIGLIGGSVPPLDAFYRINHLIDGISIITFESTLLLTIPAFASLYGWISWILDHVPVEDT